MGELPAPLVPPEVNMGGNDWFPLYHRRLRKSRWWRIASDTARSRNVDLWCHAFEETPAGSLPDDDLELAEAAGFGRDIAAFQAIKVDIMAPWTLCRDGRWYHPSLCEVVLEAWGRTSERRRKDRLRQAQHRAQVRQPAQAQSVAVSLGVTRDEGELSRVTDAEVTHGDALQTDRHDKHSAASAAPLTAVDGGKSEKVLSQREPWLLSPEFVTFWDGCTRQARRRSSGGKAWAEWTKLRKEHSADQIICAHRAYLKDDPDVRRTGGPGVHIWLRDKFDGWADSEDLLAAEWTPERWAVAVELWTGSGEWAETLGPPPGSMGCRVPQAILTAAGLGLRVVNGGAL